MKRHGYSNRVIDVVSRKLVTNSIIYSHKWRGYLNLSQFVPVCIQYSTVNYTFNFVDHVTGPHTQVIILFLFQLYSCCLPLLIRIIHRQYLHNINYCEQKFLQYFLTTFLIYASINFCKCCFLINFAGFFLVIFLKFFIVIFLVLRYVSLKQPTVRLYQSVGMAVLMKNFKNIFKKFKLRAYIKMNLSRTCLSQKLHIQVT